VRVAGLDPAIQQSPALITIQYKLRNLSGAVQAVAQPVGDCPDALVRIASDEVEIFRALRLRHGTIAGHDLLDQAAGKLLGLERAFRLAYFAFDC
jgi:hypothetical protein